MHHKKLELKIFADRKNIILPSMLRSSRRAVPLSRKLGFHGEINPRSVCRGVTVAALLAVSCFFAEPSSCMGAGGTNRWFRHRNVPKEGKKNQKEEEKIHAKIGSAAHVKEVCSHLGTLVLCHVRDFGFSRAEGMLRTCRFEWDVSDSEFGRCIMTKGLHMSGINKEYRTFVEMRCVWVMALSRKKEKKQRLVLSLPALRRQSYQAYLCWENSRIRHKAM